MIFTNSSLDLIRYRNRDIFVKRDDLLSKEFSGNKARKFHFFLNQNTLHVDKIISYGSNQSNAMYSLSVLAKQKGVEFLYYCNHIPSFLKQNPVGNYKYALENGMKIFESLNKEKEASSQVDEQTLFIDEGGRQKEAEYGVKILAQELLENIKQSNIKNPYLFLPSGTGTTALFLQKHLPFKVFTCSCVGSDYYLKEQWRMVENNEDIFPTILNIDKKYHYGKLNLDLFELWFDIKNETKIEFDLMYDPIGWKIFLAYINKIKGTPIYIHQGGLLGNESMLARYKHKYSKIYKKYEEL